MSNAERLRATAADMREKARAALDGRDYDRAIAKLGRRTKNGRHAAAMHPAVGLAVADWLDREAWRTEVNDLLDGYGPALAVCDAYWNEGDA